MKLIITHVHDLFVPICILEVPMEVHSNVADEVDGFPWNTGMPNHNNYPL